MKHNLQTEWIRVTVSGSESPSPQGMVGISKIMIISVYTWAQLTDWVYPSHCPQGWLEWARFSHYDHQCVHINTIYTEWIRVTMSTGHGWNEQDFHIMIFSVYTQVQLTFWVNPSHHPQDMIGMGKIFTLLSSVCTHEYNLHSEWIRWLEWARFSHFHNQCVHTSTTYILSESKSPSTGHGRNWQNFHIVWSLVCTHEHNLQSEWIRVTIHRLCWNELEFHIMIISVYTWAQLTVWVNPSHQVHRAW